MKKALWSVSLEGGYVHVCLYVQDSLQRNSPKIVTVVNAGDWKWGWLRKVEKWPVDYTSSDNHFSLLPYVSLPCTSFVNRSACPHSKPLGTVDVLKAWLTPFPPWESMSNAVTYKTVCEHVQQSVWHAVGISYVWISVGPSRRRRVSGAGLAGTSF